MFRTLGLVFSGIAGALLVAAAVLVIMLLPRRRPTV